MTLADLGIAFRQARLQSGQTQQEVSRASGVPRTRISQFELGLLPELGTVKLLNLFNAVGLELIARPRGHRRTLDDVIHEMESAPPLQSKPRQRVRHRKVADIPETDGENASRQTPSSRHQEKS